MLGGMRLSPRTSAARCAYCFGPPGEGVTCAGCGTLVHAECRTASGRCPTLGCEGHSLRPRPRRVDGSPFLFAALALAVALIYLAASFRLNQETAPPPRTPAASSMPQGWAPLDGR